MKKTTSTTRKKGQAKPASDVHSTAQDVIRFLETKAKNMDKATLAKYIGVAVLVIYGIRKSNILGGITLSLLTGIVTKFMADKGAGGFDLSDIIPSKAKS